MQIIIKPIVTEKQTQDSEKYNRYAFAVDKKANKLQVREAVEKEYGVAVEKVRTMIMPGKKRNRYTKSGIITGKTPSYKKAIVTLAEGDTIDFFSNI